MGHGHVAEHKARKGGQERVTDEKMVELYGELVFVGFKPLFDKLLEKGVKIYAHYNDHVREHAGEEFLAELTPLRTRVKDEVAEEHKGFFDGWFKRVAKEHWGSGNPEFVMEHGGGWDNTLVNLVLEGQGQRMADIAFLEDFAGIQIPNPTKGAVRPVYSKAVEMLKSLEAADVAGPPRQDDPQFPNFFAFMKAKAAYDTKMYRDGGKVTRARKVLERVEKWLKKTQEEASAPTKKDVLQGEIARLMDQITGLKAEEDAAAAEKQYRIASEKQSEWKGLEARVQEHTAELVKLEADGQQQPVTGQASSAPKPGQAGKSLGTPRVEGDPEAAKAKAGDIDAKIALIRAAMQKSHDLMGQDETIAQTKEREAKEKSMAARAEDVKDEDMETLLREARVLREAAASLRKTNETRLGEYQEMESQLAELERQQMQQPAAVESQGGEKKLESKADRRARKERERLERQQKSGSAAEPPPAGSEVTSAGSSTEPSAGTAAVVTGSDIVDHPELQVAKGGETLTKKALVAEIKASSLDQAVKSDLMRRISAKEPLEAVAEDFEIFVS